MRDLLLWHSAEEIEHKSVAFDVLRRVDDRYAVRIAGLLMASGAFVFFWNRGIEHLLRQEQVTRAQIRAERQEARARGQNRGFLRRGFLSYLRPGFHPDHVGDDVDNRDLARDWLRSTGRL
jgi:predicted metal-dependent hydrolase